MAVRSVGGAQFDQRVYGRGACDAKGAVVAMIGALRSCRS